MNRLFWLFLGMLAAALASCDSNPDTSQSRSDGSSDTDGNNDQPPCDGPSCRDFCDDDPCASDETCVRYEGCKLSEGTACSTDSSCASGSCRSSGTCGVQIGSSCTAETCDDCMRFVNNPDITFCAGECSSKSDCAGASECLAFTESLDPNVYHCWPACHPHCGKCAENWGFEGLDYVVQYEYCVDDLEPVPVEPGGAGGEGGDGDLPWECTGDCDGFACVDAQCLTACSNSSECAPEHSCMPDGKCYSGGEEGAPCGDDSDCATGSCNSLEDVCERYCTATDETWACGSYRGIECTCRDDHYCDLNGPDDYLTYKECNLKKGHALGPSCLEDYECESDNCCDGECTHPDEICVGEF